MTKARGEFKGNWPGNSKTSVADDNRWISGTCGKACQARRRARRLREKSRK